MHSRSLKGKTYVFWIREEGKSDFIAFALPFFSSICFYSAIFFRQEYSVLMMFLITDAEFIILIVFSRPNLVVSLLSTRKFQSIETLHTKFYRAQVLLVFLTASLFVPCAPSST